MLTIFCEKVTAVGWHRLGHHPKRNSQRPMPEGNNHDFNVILSFL
jgi:hypothetical protein